MERFQPSADTHGVAIDRTDQDKTDAATAPFGGYWQPAAPQQLEQVRAYGAGIPPGATWQHMLTVPHDPAAVQPRTAANLSREVVLPALHLSCRFDDPCPVSGIWQP